MFYRILVIDRLEYLPGEVVEVTNLARCELQSQAGQVLAVVPIALGDGYAIVRSNKNHSSALLLWNWESGRLIEVVLVRPSLCILLFALVYTDSNQGTESSAPVLSSLS